MPAPSAPLRAHRATGVYPNGRAVGPKNRGRGVRPPPPLPSDWERVRGEGAGSAGDRSPPWWMGCVNMTHGAREGVLMARLNPFEFIQEVRQEVGQVTWPRWKEVWI